MDIRYRYSSGGTWIVLALGVVLLSVRKDDIATVVRGC